MGGGRPRQQPHSIQVSTEALMFLHRKCRNCSIFDIHDFIAQFLIRAKREDGESDTELESVYGEEEGEGEPGEDLFTVRPDDVPLMNSTMISSVSMTSDPQAASKLNALQDELSSLRQQIAMLVINQEQINRSQCRCHA